MAERDLPSQHKQEAAPETESLKLFVPASLEPALKELAPELNVEVERENEPNRKSGLSKRISNVRAYFAKGKYDDVSNFKVIVGLAMNEVSKRSTQTTKEIKKHPNLTAGAAAIIFSIAAYKLIESKRQGKPLPRIGLEDGKIVE